MDVEKVARKLEPLMAEQVRQWLRARDSADPELKSLIEKQIFETAYETFGDFRSKILLSLPIRNVSSGLFHLGTVIYDKDRWPFGLFPSELIQNLGIWGRSGAGKTNLVFHLLIQLAKQNVPFLFLDVKRTARHLLPHLRSRIAVYTAGRTLSPFKFNPFVPPPGLEPNVYLNHVIDVLAESFTLGEGAKRILQKAIAGCFARGTVAPSVNDVLAEVEKMDAKDRARGWKVSALRALESISLSEATTQDPISQETMVRELLHGQTILELDGLHQSVRKMIVPLLCLWLYYCSLGGISREKLNMVIFIEEAHHFLYRQEHRSKESVLNMLMRQCREMGMGIVVIDQHPHLISSAALGNTYTSICMNLKDPSDINRAAGLSLLDESEKRYLNQLPVGHGIVKMQDRWRSPFLVRFPLIHVNKGEMTDARLKAYMQGVAGSRALRRETGVFGHVQRVRVSDIPLDETAMLLLEDILVHPDDGVKIRYKRLGWSVGKGSKLKQALIERGWLEGQTIELGNTRKLLLRLTAEMKRRLGFPNATSERESLSHEYWKRFYARAFQEQGYQTRMEAPRRGGRVDVLAEKQGTRIAVEVETGKSYYVQNVKNCLRSGFDQVLVVATTEKAMRIIERALAKEGLLIPKKVYLTVEAVGAELASKLDEQ